MILVFIKHKIEINFNKCFMHEKVKRCPILSTISSGLQLLTYSRANQFIPSNVSVSGVLFENRPALYFCNYKENEKKQYPYVGYLIY